MKGSDISIYENQFKEVNNQNYKDYLYDTYVKENKSMSKIAKLLGITTGVLQTHLRTYGIKKDHIIDTDSIMNKTPSMIEKETGRKFIDIYNELYYQGLSLTEIAIKLHIKRVGDVSKYLTLYRRKQENELDSNEDKLIIKGLKGRNLSTIERMFREQLGIEYKDFLEQKYLKEGLSPSDISKLIGVHISTINTTLNQYELNKTISQARKDLIENGDINYDEILSKSRKTRNKSKALSHKQDLLVTLIKYNLELLFNELDNTEIIVGYNEYCVLGSLEIDIPIIVIKNNQIYKIALEYDGDNWHENRKTIDKQKDIQLKEKNWYLIRIEETNSESADLWLLEEKANHIVNQIINLIKEPE
jgi:transposase